MQNWSSWAGSSAANLVGHRWLCTSPSLQAARATFTNNNSYKGSFWGAGVERTQHAQHIFSYTSCPLCRSKRCGDTRSKAEQSWLYQQWKWEGTTNLYCPSFSKLSIGLVERNLQYAMKKESSVFMRFSLLLLVKKTIHSFLWVQQFCTKISAVHAGRGEPSIPLNSYHILQLF